MKYIFTTYPHQGWWSKMSQMIEFKLYKHVHIGNVCQT